AHFAHRIPTLDDSPPPYPTERAHRCVPVLKARLRFFDCAMRDIESERADFAARLAALAKCAAGRKQTGNRIGRRAARQVAIARIAITSYLPSRRVEQGAQVCAVVLVLGLARGMVRRESGDALHEAGLEYE